MTRIFGRDPALWLTVVAVVAAYVRTQVVAPVSVTGERQA